MRRSAGITIAAAFDFLGGGFCLLSAVTSIVLFALKSLAPELPSWFRLVEIFVGVLFVAAAAWMIATGVGLIKLKEWSRISHIVIASLVTLFTLPGALMFSFAQLPVVPGQAGVAASQQFLVVFRFMMAFVYGAQAGLGIWWLYYFNKRGVRDEFGAAATVSGAVGVASAAPASAAARTSIPVQIPPPMGIRRPVSISIIAVLLFLGAASLVSSLFFTGMPLFMFSYPITGKLAALIVVPLAVLQAFAGVGLLKLKGWGRMLAIVVIVFGFVNSAATLLMPGSSARLDAFMADIYGKMNLPITVPMIHFPLWLGMIGALPVLAVELYFVVTRKDAFDRPDVAARTLL